jgi:CP family cyanate transporter-like MFS transporter
MSPREVAQPRPRHLLWLAGAIVFTALNLRTAVASVPPLLDELRADVPLSATAAGALTTLPVICMATGASIAPRVARRIGTEAAVAALALTMAAGMLLRLLPGAAALFAGTTVAGLGIALGNVLVPSLIKRDFPERQVGAMTGGYTMAISASGAIAAALTAPSIRAGRTPCRSARPNSSAVPSAEAAASSAASGTMTMLENNQSPSARTNAG